MDQPKNRSDGRLPLGAGLILALLCFLWGGNAIAVKISNQGFPPLLAAGLRSLVAGLLLWAYARSRGAGVAVPRGQTRHALIIGLLFGIEFLFVYWGLSLTTASRSSIFLYTAPFWVALGAHLLLPGDRLTLVKSLGLVLAFGGVVLVLGARSTELPPLYWVGDLMGLAAAVFWAATTLYIKRVMGDVAWDHYQTLFAQLIYSVPVLVLGSVLIELPAELNLGPLIVGSLIYQSVIVACASFLVWFWLINRYPVSRLAGFTFMAPMFAVILGGWVLGEPVTVLVWAGLGCVAVGVYLVNR